MPIYEYQCANCGYEMEELQSMSEQPLTKCPKCGKEKLKKMIGVGGGLIFKGSGFYQTDYVKNKMPSSKTEKNVEHSGVPSGSIPSGGEKPTEKQPDKPAAKKEISTNTKPE